MYTEDQLLKEVHAAFPFFSNNTEDWILFENAGGSQTTTSCISYITQYLSGANVQLRAHNELSDECMKKVNEGVRAAGTLMNAKEPARYIQLSIGV
jgi:selenocysteine lyase/cysteine desulfurase